MKTAAVLQQDAVFAGGLSKTYKSFRGRPVKALENVTLRIPRGSSFGLLGPNGAGKTTFSKILLGCVRPTAGIATIFGEPAGSQASRAKIGYVAEVSSAPEHLTARQFVEFQAALYRLDAMEGARRAGELLDTVGLGSRCDEEMRRYSKGMRQRAAIAAALVHRPRMLILDEPTEGLDPEGRRHVIDLIRSLNRDLGITLLIHSHLLHEVESLCTSVALLNRGKLIREGDLRTLTARQGYTVTLGNVPPSLAAALQLRFDLEQMNASGNLRFDVPSRDDLDWALNEVRNAGARLENLAARGTLEELFLEETRGELAWQH